MKSFGVRLGAGLVTIIFGCYAAALAQKDKQNDASSWTAGVPSLGEPAAPIAAMNEESWLSKPADASRSAVAALGKVVQANANFDSTEHDDVFGTGSVALVQHTEDLPPQNFAPPKASMPMAMPSGPATAMPAALGSPQAVPDSSDWTLPESDQHEAPHAERSLSMTFPSEAPVAELQQPPQPIHDAQDAPATPMPQLAIADVPDVEYYDDAQDQSEAEYGNSLRGVPADANALRGNPPLPPQETYDAPKPMTFAAPAAQSLQPVANPEQDYAPARNANQNAPPERIASLPSGGNGIPRGYAPEQEYGRAPMGQTSGIMSIDPNTVVDSPGDRRLEGAQSPSVVIQKRAPAEVKVGKPASFVIQVKNVGSAEALDVKVHDRVPAGMHLVDASPTPVQQGDILMWELGALAAGDERTLTMQLVPEAEGELGSVARVTFEAAASVRTISTRPELKIVQRGPEKVLIGQQLEIELEVSNPGTGEATNVALQEDVPEGLEHPKGRQLDNMIGSLAPGEIRRQVLRLRAVAPGMIQNQIRLVSDDGLTAESTINVEVIAPRLEVELTGPSRRYLERQATYQLEIANSGTADATNVEVAVQLDRGFTFVSTEYEGQYDPSRHAVYWSLAQLQAGGQGSVPLTLLPVEEGERALVIDARADLGIVAKSERAVTVEGLAELSFQITNSGGPIELGAETSYEISVRNGGSKSDQNVRVTLELPAGLELVSADGDAGTDGRGLVAFQPHAQLPPGADMKYRVRVRGVAPGTHLVKAVVVSDHANKPVAKEESTLVYEDR